MNNLTLSLRNRRAAIQDCIDEEQARPAPDGIRLRNLKKMKLRLREQIEFLERQGRDGTIRTIPVHMRRPMRFVDARTQG